MLTFTAMNTLNTPKVKEHKQDTTGRAVVELLLQKGANVNKMNKMGLTPLLIVCLLGVGDILDLIVSHKGM
jgi:ankyrin repeat protein